MDFKTIPPRPDVMPVVPSNNSRFFNKARVKTLADLKPGYYLRLWWQPLFANGHMLSMETVRVRGRPYVHHDKDGCLGNGWKIKKHLSAKEQAQEAWFDDKDPVIRELGRSHYVSSLGIGQRLYAEHSSQAYRFSNKMLLELKRIQSLGDFATFCWLYNLEPNDENYIEFAYRVGYEREMDRAMDAMDFSMPDMHDCADDVDYDADYRNEPDEDEDGYKVTETSNLDLSAELAVEASADVDPTGPYDHLEDMKFSGRRGII